MQELEKILEEIDWEKKNALLSIEHTTGYKAGQVDMTERIKEIIRKHMNDGWIPCSERMPTKEECEKDNNEFLVQTDTGERFSCEYDPLANGFDNPLWCCNVPVVAWRPLPDQYRPERSKGE